MNYFLKTLMTVLVIGFAFSATQAQERKIKRAQLPPAVETTVVKESEGATIKGFTSEIEHGQKFYEMSLSVNGHNKDILIDKNGNVVEVEEEVSLDSLPGPVQDALKKAAGAGTIENIESLMKNGTLVAYEAHIKRGILPQQNRRDLTHFKDCANSDYCSETLVRDAPMELGKPTASAIFQLTRGSYEWTETTSFRFVLECSIC